MHGSRSSPRCAAALALLVLALCALTGASARAQLSAATCDRVYVHGGEPLQGRILERFSDPLVLDVDGKHREFAQAEIERVDWVTDRLRLWLAELAPASNLAESWRPVERAQAERLPAMAELAAWRALLLDPEDERAHTLLGHARKGRRWQWPLDGKSLDYDAFAQQSREWNHRLALESLHYRIETDAGLALALDTLIDLERFYCDWMLRFGQELEPAEYPGFAKQGGKLLVRVHRQQFELADALNELKEPYYAPGGQLGLVPGGENAIRTFVEPGQTRPRELFALATEQMLYSTLLEHRSRAKLGGAGAGRCAPALEFGFGWWLGKQYDGPAGQAQRVPFAISSEADRVLAAFGTDEKGLPPPLDMGQHSITNVIGLGHDKFHDASELRVLYRAKAATWVAFMLDDASVYPHESGAQPTQRALLRYLKLVFRAGLAHSSSALDEALSVPGSRAHIERLQSAWQAWCKSKAGSAMATAEPPKVKPRRSALGGVRPLGF